MTFTNETYIDFLQPLMTVITKMPADFIKRVLVYKPQAI